MFRNYVIAPGKFVEFFRQERTVIQVVYDGLCPVISGDSAHTCTVDVELDMCIVGDCESYFEVLFLHFSNPTTFVCIYTHNTISTKGCAVFISKPAIFTNRANDAAFGVPNQVVCLLSDVCFRCAFLTKVFVTQRWLPQVKWARRRRG